LDFGDRAEGQEPEQGRELAQGWDLDPDSGLVGEPGPGLEFGIGTGVGGGIKGGAMRTPPAAGAPNIVTLQSVMLEDA
jgi:hypothetical protein